MVFRQLREVCMSPITRAQRAQQHQHLASLAAPYPASAAAPERAPARLSVGRGALAGAISRTQAATVGTASPMPPAAVHQRFGAAVQALGIGSIVNRHDLTAALSLELSSNAGSLDPDMKQMLRHTYEAPGQNSSCHITAERLRVIMGQGELPPVGGAGLENRRQAIAHCQSLLEPGQPPCIISIKGAASDDGHSFSLVAQGDRVDALEAWGAGAEDANPGDLHSLLGELKAGLSLQQARRALNCLSSADAGVRTRGYTALSIAYKSSLGFEKAADGQRRDTDENISLVVHSCLLKPPAEIQETMATRLAEVQAWKEAIGL